MIQDWGRHVALRSMLFAPGTRPDLIRKLPRANPDAAIIDLEDAVPESGKEEGRTVARGLAQELAESHPGLRVFIRVNPVGSPWFKEDMVQILLPTLAGIVVPKLEAFGQIEQIREALWLQDMEQLIVMAGIETAAGVYRVHELLGPPVRTVYFGAEDFVADMGGDRTEGGLEVLYARSRVALAARLMGMPALDIVVTDFHDDNRFIADANMGRSLGYTGKMCIHPSQVQLANRVFSPSWAEIERAQKLLAAYEESSESGRGVIDFDGQMVDQPMVTRAREILRRAAEFPPVDELPVSTT
jgi:citrate lyase subunit beta / citryl-CoA lyase